MSTEHQTAANFTCNFLLILIPKKGVSANNFLLHEFLLHISEDEGYKKVFVSICSVP